jgi:hypothetical protein
MSLLTKASLITTPTAYDGGVLNSVKPTNRENLLLQSNGFDTTWTAVNASVTSGQTGYDGSSDAWKLESTSSGVSGSVRQFVSESGAGTFSVYAKAGNVNLIALYVASSSGAFNLWADLSAGTIGTTSGIIDTTITSVSDGWYRISITGLNFNQRVDIYPANTNGSYITASGEYIYIQDAQLQKGITATQYVETTTTAVVNGDFSFLRASAATRVNEQGLIEKEIGNLIIQSNQFDTTWGATRASLTGGESGYDGSNDAWAFIDTADNSTHLINQSFSLGSSVATFSVYAKAGSRDFLSIRFEGSTVDYAYFNLSSGTLGTIDSDYIEARIVSIGSGWYRCEVTRTLPASGNQVVLLSADANNDPTYAGSGDTAIYIQDAQLEQGLVATDYIETTTAAVYEGITDNIPRINYENGIGSLLLEGQRTNIIDQSEYIASWIDVRITQETNYATSPEGVQNATRVVMTSATGEHSVYTAVSVTSGTQYTQSIFLKQGDGSANWRYFQFRFRTGGFGGFYGVVVDLQEGTIGYDFGLDDYGIEDYGNGWYRVWITATATTTSSYAGPVLAFNELADAYSVSIVGDTNADVLIYGSQFEASSYPTSYIPTYGSSVTRVAETCDNAGDSSLFNDSEGVLYAEIAALADDSTYRFISLSDGTLSNRVSLFLSNSNTLNGSANGVSSIASTVDIKDNNKVAYKYKSGDYSLWVNGFEVGTSTVTTGNHSNLNRLNFDYGQGSDDFYGKTKMVATFKEALSDSELECLTSWSSFNRMATAQGYTIE